MSFVAQFRKFSLLSLVSGALLLASLGVLAKTGWEFGRMVQTVDHVIATSSYANDDGFYFVAEPVTR